MKSENNTSPTLESKTEELTEPLKSMVENIQWYGQSSIRIPFGDKFIYIDPFQIIDKEMADLILITHPHFDHFSIEDINKIANPDTRIYAPKESCEKLQLKGYKNCIEVVPDQTITFEGITIHTVPAYNLSKYNHPKEMKWVGYVINLGDLKIYHPGDTNRIPEMKSISCDIAFMPLGQTYTMQSVEEATDAILDVKAKVAIPIHYGTYEGTVQSALQFKKMLSNKVITVIKECRNKLQTMY
jgi:L-ascorbate metabolism protein UlaG (beta-lactamase superfamily)